MFKTLELPGGFAPLAPLPGFCPGPTGGLKRLPDPSPNNFAPPISNSWLRPCRPTSYHPQGNGQVERFNLTHLGMLRTLPASAKANWKSHLNKLVHAYNCTQNDSIGHSPFYLLFCRQPRLAIDGSLWKPSHMLSMWSAGPWKWEEHIRVLVGKLEMQDSKGNSSTIELLEVLPLLRETESL